MSMRDLPPHVRAEAQRVLDAEAERRLAKWLDANALRDRRATGTNGDRRERETDQRALSPERFGIRIVQDRRGVGDGDVAE